MLVDEAHQAQLNRSGPQLACYYLNKENGVSRFFVSFYFFSFSSSCIDLNKVFFHVQKFVQNKLYTVVVLDNRNKPSR